MAVIRAVALVLLVALAGCTGVAPTDSGTTDPPTSTTVDPTSESLSSTGAPTTDTTLKEPHTAVGTSHTSMHFVVLASAHVENVTVTLAPDGDSTTYELDAGRQRDLTHEIHERGHDITVLVERGDETVFDHAVQGYESYRLVVEANDTRVSVSEV